jgi:quercetin dioxygenase-like cupin family protein
VEEYGGEIPSATVVLVRLPSIGPYTAGAVACFTFERDVPHVVDVVEHDDRLARLRGPPHLPCLGVDGFDLMALGHRKSLVVSVPLHLRLDSCLLPGDLNRDALGFELLGSRQNSSLDVLVICIHALSSLPIGCASRERRSRGMVKAGDVLENPVTGERLVVRRVVLDDPGGERGEADLYIKPGGTPAGEHVHPAIEEDITVLKGQVGISLDGRESIVPLNQRVRMLPGVAHDWWNAGEEEAHVFVEGSGPGALRLTEIFQNLFGLAQDGKTNTKGMPNLLQGAILLREFEDVLHFTNPPRVVQRVLFGPLATIARVLGYKGSYPKYTDSDVRSGGKGEGPPSTTEVVVRAAPIAGALLLSAFVLVGWRRRLSA